MNGKIAAVAFDLGGTLENIYYDDDSRLEATRGLQALLTSRALDPGLTLRDLQAAILSGIRAYQHFRETTLKELPPEEIWCEYIFPTYGLPKDRLAAAAEDLAFFYENHFYTRALRPEAPAVLAALQGHGLRLAVISNVTSHRQVRYNLEAYGIDHYFAVIMTSSGLGIRKPDPRIFLETARLLQVPPAACAYVGDTVSRDVVGARRAGYGIVIQIKSFLTDKADRATDIEPPDAVISNLRQVVNLVSSI